MLKDINERWKICANQWFGWEWYTRARASYIPVDSPMLAEEAWLARKVEKGNNISQVKIAGEE